MGLFDKFRAGLKKTHDRLFHEIKRVVTRSPKVTADMLEELEYVLIGADLGMAVTTRVTDAVKRAFETQGTTGAGLLEVARKELETSLECGDRSLAACPDGVTVVSMVGVNGTGKTTTCAKLARRLQAEGKGVALAACDTFRAAAVEQLKVWGERLSVPVIAGTHGADPAAVAHDGLSAAEARGLDYLLVDTAGRLHTKQNLMQELAKVHRVLGRKRPGAPHEVLLVLDATTGMNALIQAREFHKAVSLTGLVVTKLDGTSKGGMVIGIQQELGIPVKFVGLGEKADDLEPFDPAGFAAGLFDPEAVADSA